MGTGDSAFTSASASGSTVSGPLDSLRWTRADLIDQRDHVLAQPAPLARYAWLWRDLLYAINMSLMDRSKQQPCWRI